MGLETIGLRKGLRSARTVNFMRVSLVATCLSWIQSCKGTGLSGLELDGFVGLAVDDAELDLPDGAHFEAAMVVGEGEGFDAVFGDAVAHALQVGEVGKHGENAGVVVGNGADGAGEFCHYVCTKEE